MPTFDISACDCCGSRDVDLYQHARFPMVAVRVENGITRGRCPWLCLECAPAPTDEDNDEGEV